MQLIQEEVLEKSQSLILCRSLATICHIAQTYIIGSVIRYQSEDLGATSVKLVVMMYYSAQMKASIAFGILHFMVSDCSSVPLHTNRSTPNNSSNSTVPLSSRPPKFNEDASAMVISHGSESEAKPIFHGNHTKNNVNALKNAEISVTINTNKNLTEDDSHDSIHTIRSKRSTQCSILGPRLSISSETQKWVNYLANYKVSCNECHNYCSVNSSEVCSYTSERGTHLSLVSKF
jgi:hypothetical protein